MRKSRNLSCIEGGTHHNNRLCRHPADGDEEAVALAVVFFVVVGGVRCVVAADGVVVPGVDGVVAAKVAYLQVVGSTDQAVPETDEKASVMIDDFVNVLST